MLKIGFEKEVFESQIDLETSFNSDISSDEDEEEDTQDDEPEKIKSDISNAEHLKNLHEMRLFIESSNESEETLRAVSILEKFFMKKKLVETRKQSKITDCFKSNLSN